MLKISKSSRLEEKKSTSQQSSPLPGESRACVRVGGGVTCTVLFFIDDTPFLQGHEGKHRAAISDWRGTEAALSSHPKRKKETTTGEHGT